MPVKQSAWEGGKPFTKLSGGSAVSTFRNLWHSRCVILAKLSWAVHVLDYPNVPLIPLQSFTGPVFHSWEPVGTCTGELGHPLLLVRAGPPELCCFCNPASPFSFHLPLPSQSSITGSPLQGSITAPSISIITRSSPLSTFHDCHCPPSPTQETVSRATHNAVEITLSAEKTCAERLQKQDLMA